MLRRLSLIGVLVVAASVAAVVVLATRSTPAPASAEGELVNVTLNIPADVRQNPCNGEFVNLSGRLHIVLSVRTDNAGGYHVTQQTDEVARGTGLTSGDTYVASDNKMESWDAKPPFPQIYTTTHSILLASNGTAPNFLFLYAVHTTVTAAGIPSATVDNFQTRCTP